MDTVATIAISDDAKKWSKDYAFKCEQPKIKYCRENHGELLSKFYGVDKVDKLSDTQVVEYLQGEGRFTTVIGLLDVNLYLVANPDLQKAGLTGEKLVEHFVKHGQFEERVFSLVFNSDIYRLLNKDLAGMKPAVALDHFLKKGCQEGRVASPFVDINFYRKNHKDLAGMSAGEALQHLMKYGLAENRQVSAFINLSFYRESYSDLKAMSSQEALIHLMSHGLKEGRKFSPFFDLDHYRRVNVDLKGITAFEALHHLMEYGLKEARNFSPQFDLKTFTTINAQALLNFFGVKSIQELDLAKVFEFMITVGGDKAISPPTVDTTGTTENPVTGTVTGTTEVATGTPTTPETAPTTSPTPPTDSTTDTTSPSDSSNPTDDNPPLPVPPKPPTTPNVTPPPVSAATPYVDAGFIITTNLEKLKLKFPGFELDKPEKLTQDQVNKIIAFAQEVKLNPAPFVDVKLIEFKLKDQGIVGKLKVAGYTEEQIKTLTGEKAGEALLKIGESPTPLVNFKFIFKKHPELEAKFKDSEGKIDYKGLFEFVNKEGAKLGLNLSPFFKPSGFKNKNIKELVEHITEKNGITVENLKDAEKITDKKVLDAAGNSQVIVNIDYSLSKYAVQIATYFQAELSLTKSDLTYDKNDELIEKIKKALSDGKIDSKAVEKFVLVSFGDKPLGTCEINFTGIRKDGTLKTKLKEYFFATDATDAQVEGLSEKQIKEFISGKAWELKLDLSKFVDVSFLKFTYEKQLKNLFPDKDINILDANKIIRFVFDDSSVYFDKKFFLQAYGEKTTSDGKKLKDLDDKSLKLYALGEGWGTTKLSAFVTNIKLKIVTGSVLEQALLKAYNATTVDEISQGKIIAFIKGEGLKKGLVKNIEEFLDADAIKLLKEANKAEIANYFNIDISAVDSLSASLIFDFKAGGLSQVLDIDYLKSTLTEVAGFSSKEILEYVYKTLLTKEDFNADKLSPIKINAFISVEANAKALKEFFGVKDVAQIDVKDIQKFILTEAKKLGLAIDNVVDVKYFRTTFAAQIAFNLGKTVADVSNESTVTNDQILEWCSKDKAKIDVDFLRHEISSWLKEAKLTTTEIAGFLALDSATFNVDKLSDKQVIDLCYKAEFMTLLKTKSLELNNSPIDVKGFIDKYGIKLAEFYMSDDDDDDDKTITDDKKQEFAKTLTVDQVLNYMGKVWLTEGTDLTGFVKLDYLRTEFALDIAKYFNVSLDIVNDKTQFTDSLILDWKFGGLSKYLDKEYLAKAKNITADADWKLIKLAYIQGLKTADVAAFDVEGYSQNFLKQIAKALKVPYGQLKKLDKEEIDKIKEFAFGAEGLKLAEDKSVLKDLFKTDYFRNEKGKDIAHAINIKNAYLVKPEDTQAFMAEGKAKGLETSELIDKAWYKTTYAQDLEADKKTIDTNGNGTIEDGELVDYITGAGLQKGNNPSQAIDIKTYRETRTTDLLTEFKVTSLNEVSYEQTINFMLTTGLEKGYNTSTKLMDYNQYKEKYGSEMVKYFGVQSATEITPQQTFEFSISAGLQIGINPYIG